MTQIMAGFHRFMVMLGMNEIGFSWVMSIVFLVIVVQACVFPLFYKSMKGMRKMQAQMAVLQPKMQRIQNKYKGKNDPASKEALQREMMKLYQDNDANPMGGCTSMLPMFVQGPVFMCMFYTLSAIPYIARGKFRNGSGLGAFDIATAQAVHLHQRVRRERGRELHHRRHPRQDHHRHLRGVDVLLPVAHAVQQHEAQHGPERCEQAD